MNPNSYCPATKTLLAACISAIVLSACGGDGGAAGGKASAAPVLATKTTGSPTVDVPGLEVPPPPVEPPEPPGPTVPPPPVGATLTTLHIVDKAAVAQINVPLTFGQVFVKGAFPANTGLAGVYNGTQLPLQVNVKSTHADGSVRHAVISAILPQLNAGQTAPLALTAIATPPPNEGDTPGQVLGGFNTVVNVTVGGQIYSASVAPLLKLGKYTTWLAGPVANEWLASMPLKSAANVEHPHLAARFALRRYSNGKIRIDVTVENNWAYEPDPKNLTYDAEVLVNGQRAYAATALTHFHHARWRKLFWTAGAEPKLHLKHDTRYLIASQALPNYDQSLTVPAATLTAMKTTWDAANTGPMGMAMLTRAMGTTGGRPDIGLHHGWAAMYVLSQDERAKQVTLGLSDLGGSWPIHYRDRKTDLPVSIQQYPYVRDIRVGTDSYNPVTKLHENLPQCTATGQCAVPYQPDTSHQPSLAFLPFLVTGDAYHLDELLFWSNFNLITKNPHYRGLAKGLVTGEQVRGQAWTMRTLAHAAYITPDGHPMKAYFNQILDHNIEKYNTTFAAGATNQLGFIDNTLTSYAVAYPGYGGPNTGVAPWMDDFFTSATGHILELGFTRIKPLLDWKSRFPIGRMLSPSYCFVDGAVYAMNVRASATAPYFASFAQAYQATMRTSTGGDMVNSTGKRYLDQPCGSQAQADWRSQVDKDNNVWRTLWAAGEMTGYAYSQTGYPANMQPALAVAATSGIPDAAKAWTVFSNRAVKPAYGAQPQFAIVPR